MERDIITVKDANHLTAAKDGSMRLLKALCEAQGREWRGPSIPDLEVRHRNNEYAWKIGGQNARRLAASVAKINAERAYVDSLRNPRTACIYCGVRSDVGCRHNPKF